LVEVFWGCCADDVDDVDTLSPNNNVSDKAKSNLFIAPLLFLIKIVPPRKLSCEGIVKNVLMTTLFAEDYASGGHLFDGL